MTVPRKRAVPRPPAVKAVPPPEPVPADQSDNFRAWAVTEAVRALVGGDTPYEPETYGYYPDRDKALQILIRSMHLCAKVTDIDVLPVQVQRHLADAYRKLGVALPAPFAQYVAYKIEART